MPRQKYMMGLNPQYLCKDDENKSLNVDNMWYFYGNYNNICNICIDTDLKINGECKDCKRQVNKVIREVCNAIKTEGQVM